MKTKLIAFVLAMFTLASFSFGQQKPQKQKKFRFPKVSLDVKKEAKRYEKDKWQVFPGNAPIKQQLDNAFRRQAETSDDGFPKWVVSNGSSVAQTQAAAEMQAIELGKNRLVGLLQTQMKAVVESDVSNNQLDAKDAASITKTIEVSANRVSKKLGRVAPLFKVYRSVGQNTEVQVLLGYSYEMAQKEIIAEMKYELQLETDDVRKRYEKFLNPENYKEGEIKNYADQ
jgi:hypothetical protein